MFIEKAKARSERNQETVPLNVVIPPSLEPLGIHFISTERTPSPRIRSFETNSRALGILMVGDTITHVNGLMTNGAVKTENMLRSAIGKAKEVEMTLLRQKTVKARILKPTTTSPFGMTLTHSASDGLWITGVKEGGLAAKTFLIAPPCRVCAINDKPETCKSWRNAVDELSSRLEATITLEYGQKLSLYDQPTDEKAEVHKLRTSPTDELGPLNVAAVA